jgi:drug/metabolite transporter (DMT)-like permease
VRIALLIAIVVITGTAGEICATHAMKRLGTVTSFRPAVVLRALRNAFRLWWMWLAIALMAVAFFSLLAALSWADASIVIPATALNYVAGVLGAKFLLRERISRVRWAGALLVCAGVALLSLG